MYRSDPVQRTNQKQLPLFEILNLESNCSKYLSKCLLHSSSVAYCIFEQSADVEKIIVVLQAICCTPICWFNPQGFRTAGMLAPVPGTADRPGILHPRTRLFASGKFLAATVLCSSDTDPANQHPQSRAGHHGLSECSYQDAG